MIVWLLLLTVNGQPRLEATAPRFLTEATCESAAAFQREHGTPARCRRVVEARPATAKGKIFRANP